MHCLAAAWMETLSTVQKLSIRTRKSSYPASEEGWWLVRNRTQFAIAIDDFASDLNCEGADRKMEWAPQTCVPPEGTASVSLSWNQAQPARQCKLRMYFRQLQFVVVENTFIAILVCVHTVALAMMARLRAIRDEMFLHGGGSRGNTVKAR